MGLFLATMLSVPFALAPPSQQRATDTLPVAGTVTGRLVAPGGEAVPHGIMAALPDGSQILSDTQGGFLFTGLHPGLVVLRIRALGFQPRYVYVQLAEDHGWRGVVQLEFVAQVLPEVRVRGVPAFWKPPEYANTRKYDDFFMRMRRASGTFLDRESIRRRNATSLLELLQGIPGISVRWSPPGSPAPTTVRMARCPGNPPPLAFYIDGFRIPLNTGSPKTAGGLTLSGGSRETQTVVEERFEEILNSVHPSGIEMMEVYRGVAEIPSDLARDVCAVIVVWTR